MEKQLCIALLLFLMACSKGNKQQAQMGPQVLKVVEVEKSNVPLVNEHVGQVYGFFDIPVRTRVEGFLEELEFKEGSRVKKGQHLYTVDPQVYQQKVLAQKSLVAASEVEVINAENNLKRIKPLAEINAVSQRELDESEAYYQGALDKYKAAQAELRMAEIELGYTRITSPIDGIIGKSEAKIGEFVGRSPNPVILNTVSKIDSVHVRFFISENDYLLLARAVNDMQSGLILRDGYDLIFNLIFSDQTIYELPGSFDFIDRSINPETGAVLIQTTFPNPKLLIRPGQFAKIRTTLKRNAASILVPKRCVSELQGELFVYLLNDQNTLERKIITVDFSYGDQYVVSSGLLGGEKVLLEGLKTARSGMTIEPELVKFESKSGFETE
ncbi:efflux RND transporter periplasmic adaptor subunit [Echinicola salinicaeni]|uniref:efflux RND transporter periplasmic adaptor subunit n=1 Tax=Echinicola salinicaeni TaxID=2762757 RepID=UPI00164690A9|nr:efflux RND transporter periplasmic adaptor subunit [Echinicola salinicaeni]